jgi:hypothetical protein
MSLPQVRLQPWYPGQMGVAGSDVQRGLRWSPTAIVLYVDKNHPGASATADGTDPEHPLTTVQAAVDRLVSFQTAMAVSLIGSVIVVGAGATITESVTVPYTAPIGCTIMGESNGAYVPTWQPATATGVALTLQAASWRVTGIKFQFTGNGVGVRLARADPTYNAKSCVIDNCHFWGSHYGLYAIEFVGSPSKVEIDRCVFEEIHSVGDAGTAFAICVTSSSDANPFLCRITNNVFWECENYIGSLADNQSFNVSLIAGNTFHPGAGIITVNRKVDLRGGSRGYNIVTGNVFYGDYSNAGGYWDHATATGFWGGNLSDDLLCGQVADNGFTVAPPL